jgi:hypothetical protein
MKHFVLPDVQAKPGNNFTFLTNIGKYIVDKQPDVIVCIGDFADMASLSSFDVGTKAYEGKRYTKDVDASHEAMDAFLSPLNNYNAQQRKNGKKQYKPRRVLTLGNHEQRILKAVNKDAKLDGLISIDDLEYEKYGWEVYPFLHTVIIDGVAYAHYFVTGIAGRPASTAAAQLRVVNMSCVAGHQQGKQIAYAKRGDGATLTSIIAGSCYEHDEDYLNVQGNLHWRGAFMLHEVDNGHFDEMWLSLNYLNNRNK